MPAHIVTTEDLMVFKEELLEELQAMLAQTYPPAQEWLRSSEVRERLNISASTLQTFRINGVLPYSKIGGILFYPQKSIERALEENLVGNVNAVIR